MRGFREDKRDIAFKVSVGVIITIWLMLLLFNLYWMMLSSLKDQSAIYKSTPDLVPTIKYRYELTLDSTGHSGYGYDDFKKESTMMAWYLFDKKLNTNNGCIQVNWTEEGKLLATTQVTERLFKQYRNKLFTATNLTAYYIYLNSVLEGVYEVMEREGCYWQGKKAYAASIKENEHTQGFLSEANGIRLTNRQGEDISSAYSFENPVKAITYSYNWSGIFDNYIVAYQIFLNEGVTFFNFMFNSSLISVGAVLGQWIVMSMAAYGLTFLVGHRARNTLRLFFLAVSMIPGIVYIVPLYAQICKYNLIDNKLAIILPGIPNVMSLLYFSGFFSGVPKDLREAAKIDGANEIYIFCRIYVPLSKAVYGAIGLIVFTANWNDVMFPSMVLKSVPAQTLPLALKALMGNVVNGSIDYATIMAFAVMSMIPTFIIFLFSQQYLTKGLVFGGLKG